MGSGSEPQPECDCEGCCGVADSSPTGSWLHRRQTTDAWSSGSITSIDRRRGNAMRMMAQTPCSACGEYGHWRDRCPQRNRGARHSQTSWNEDWTSSHLGSGWNSSGTGAGRRRQTDSIREARPYRVDSVHRLRPGELLVDTCCPRSCARWAWHTVTRELLGLLGTRR